MSDIHGDRLIRTEAHLSAPIDLVFSAWSDPDRLVQWYPERVNGRLGLGDRVRFEWSSLGLELDLEIVELLPGSRIAFCGDPGSGPQVQTVELSPSDSGTRMTIEHSGFISADDAAGARSGWALAAAMLDEYLSRHCDMPRQCFGILGTTGVSREDVVSHYDPPTRLCPDLTGPVLAVTDRKEVLVRCDEIDGAVALRTFCSSGIVLFGAQMTSWSRRREPTERLRQQLADGVARLGTVLGGPVPSA